MNTRALRGGAPLALLLSTLAMPAAVNAQSATDPSHTEGLYLNVRAGGYGVGYEGDRDGSGGLWGIRAGYGFSQRLTAYVGLERGSTSEGDGFEGLPTGDDYETVFIDVGARFHFRRDSRVVPFAEAGASIYGLWFDNTDNVEAKYGGPTVSVGGGLLYFVTQRLGLESSLSFSIGSLMQREIAGTTDDIGITTAGLRLQVGASYYPFG